MEISLIADTVTTAATQGLGFAKFLLRRHYFTSNNHLSRYDSSSEQSSSAGVLQISAVIFPVDTVAPPPVRPNSYIAAPRRLLQKTRRTRRRSLSGDPEDGEDDGFFFSGDGGDGPFGGGGGGGDGGRGWNFDRFGGSNWDESSSSSALASDFVYEVICWIALSNCVHFAFKKVVRIVADGIGDASREKVPMRLTSMC